MVAGFGWVALSGCPPDGEPTPPDGSGVDADETMDVDGGPADVGDVEDGEGEARDADGGSPEDAADASEGNDGSDADDGGLVVDPDTSDTGSDDVADAADADSDDADSGDTADVDTGPPDCPRHLDEDEVDEEVCNPVVVECKYLGDNASQVGDDGCCTDYLTPCRVGEKNDELWDCGANACSSN